MIEAVAPKDEIEGALAVQMACTHAAAMAVLNRLGGGVGTERRVAALGSAAARLLRTYSIQVETLRRLRHGGDQLSVSSIFISIEGHRRLSATYERLTPSMKLQPHCQPRINRTIAITTQLDNGADHGEAAQGHQPTWLLPCAVRERIGTLLR